MVPTPSSPAMRRIETASTPSPSAMASAVSAICSRVTDGRRRPGSGSAQIGVRPVRPRRPPRSGASLDMSYTVLIRFPYDVRTSRTTYDRRAPGADRGGVQAAGLGKRSGDLWALRDVALDVPEGTVLGLLGHNGAGKTTAIRILTTLARPTTGSARVAGFDVVAQPRAVRERIGVAGQSAT